MDSERKEFERWFEGHCLPCESNWFERDADGDYTFNPTAHAWEGWQARAELGEGTPHCTEKLNALHVNHIALQAECEALKKANALLQQHHATAWNRGHQMGMMANRQTAREALKAVERDAWGNTQLTEALLAAEAECEALRKDAERWKTAVQVSEDAMRHPDQREKPELYDAYMMANSMGLNMHACIDAAMGKEQSND
jgi:hypothetical protein